VELKHSDYSHAKWLDIKLPRKTVIKALLVETIKPKYLKSFFLKVAEADFAQPGQLEYIEFQPNMPGLFHVFHTSPENMDEIMSRTIPLIRPRMTRRFQIEIVESAPELAFNLEIIGMSGEKAYAANKYLESDHESNYAANLVQLKIITKSEHYFQVNVRVLDGAYVIQVSGNLVNDDIKTPIPWTKLRPTQTSTYEIELKYSERNLEVLFKNDVIGKYQFKQDEVISKFSHHSNGTTSRIQFTSVHQFGAFEEYMVNKGLELLQNSTDPSLMGLETVADKGEGLLFKLLGDSQKQNFGFIPFEFKQYCFETPNGNVRCVPGTGVMSTKAFGGSEHGQMAPSCPRGYTYVGKVCKRMFEPLKPHSYQSAQTYCDSDQIYVPTNQDQNRVFRAVMRHLSELKKIEGIWIGVKKTPEGEWLTDRDRTVNAKNSDWAPGYPKPDFSGDCVIASSAHGFKWINTHCSDLQSTLCALTRPQCPT
ncbi:hypothetical protein TCAL_06222, partial [Tigriopus californicus]